MHTVTITNGVEKTTIHSDNLGRISAGKVVKAVNAVCAKFRVIFCGICLSFRLIFYHFYAYFSIPGHKEKRLSTPFDANKRFCAGRGDGT